MLYAKSTGGFYSAEIHGENIPADAVEISQEYYESLLNGQSKGNLITSDKDGAPVLTSPQPPSTDQLATSARAQRDTLLTASDWTQLPDAQASLSPEKKAAWSAYRQALRDITDQATFPQEITWPDKP